MNELNQGENDSHAADTRHRRHDASGSGYRLRRPTRFFGRIGLILFIGLFVLVMAGSLKKTAAKPSISPTAFPSATFGETAEAGPSPSADPAAELEETTAPALDTVPVLAAAPTGFAWKELLVVLDAGHGGRDPGAVSPESPEVLEKNIALAIALVCRDKLEAEGIPTILTRETDVALARKVQADLDVRTATANEADASLFISIHVNSLELSIPGAREISGMECYYAKKENLFPAVTDEAFANRLGESMAARNGKKLNAVIEKRLAVLRATKMPAALVEVGYITNPEDLDSMLSESFQDATAQGIADAVIRTVADMSPVRENGILHVLQGETLR